MAKHSNGPDLIDIECLMRAIESLHGGRVALSVFPGGIGFNGGLVTVLTYLEPSVEDGEYVPKAEAVGRFPCPVHSDFYACVFEGLYRLDAAVGRLYEQQVMPI